jgi:hypothetical protein
MQQEAALLLRFDRRCVSLGVDQNSGLQIVMCCLSIDASVTPRHIST